MTKGLVVKRKLLKVERVIGEATVREAVEAKVRLPFKIEKVYEVITNVTDVETEVRSGGVLVTGIIDKQLFVVDRGDLVRHVPEEMQFRVFVDVKGAEPEMNAQVEVRVLTVDTHLGHHETVEQAVVLEIFVKVTVTEQIEVVIDVHGPGVTARKELLKVDSVVGEDRVGFSITPEVNLPITAKKIFKILPTVRDVSAEIKKDTVIVRGTVHKQIFLVDEGELVRHAFEDVPFTKAVDIPGAKDGMEVYVDVKAVVDDFELYHPPSRRLRQTLLLDIFVKVTETLQIDVVTDVTGPGIRVSKRLLKVEHVVVDVLQRETVRSTVRLPMQAIKIVEILGKVVNLETEARRDQVLVKGTLHKQIFFVDQTNLLRHFREDVPFRFVKTAKGAEPEMNVQVRTQIIGEIMHRLADKKEVEQTAVLEIFVKVTRTVQLEVVVDVSQKGEPFPPKPHPPKPHPPKPRPPSKQTYTVQKGDTLFFIAKRFGVSLEALIQANPQIKDPNLIFPGDIIYIPRVHVPPGPPGETYTVQKGDTLYLIAKRFGVSLDALIRANPQIKDPNLIFPGDTIHIPRGKHPPRPQPPHKPKPSHPPKPSYPEDDSRPPHPSRPSYPEEPSHPSEPPYHHPSKPSYPEEDSRPSHPSHPSKPSHPHPSEPSYPSHPHRPHPRPPHRPHPPSGQTYTVQKGDTLYLIAKRFGVSLGALIQANPQFKDPNLIYPGDVVYIP